MNDYIYSSPLVRYGVEVLLCLVVDVVAPFREPALELARDAAAAPALPLRSLGLGRRQRNYLTIFDRRATLLPLDFLHDLDRVLPENSTYFVNGQCQSFDISTAYTGRFVGLRSI